jgi:hypothetical protein
MSTPLEMEAQYDRQNREAARIMLANPEKYGGMCIWARMIVSKPALTTTPLPQRTQYQGKQALLFPTNCRRR